MNTKIVLDDNELHAGEVETLPGVDDKFTIFYKQVLTPALNTVTRLPCLIDPETPIGAIYAATIELGPSERLPH